MKAGFALALVLLGGTLPGATQQSQATPPEWAEGVAEEIWTGLRAVPWDGFHHQWAEANPEASNAKWERFHGEGSSGLWADKEWCERYTLETRTHNEELYSYALPPRRPRGDHLEQFRAIGPGMLEEAPSCRFEQFRGSATGLSVAGLEEVHRALTRRLSERFGAPEEPERVHDFGAADWHHILRWQTDELELVVYIDEPRYRQPRLGLRTRHRHLLEALADDRRLNHVQYDYWRRIGKEVEQTLVSELDETFPQLARLLGYEESKPSVGETADALLQLLQKAQTAEPAQQAALLMAADRLALGLQLGLDHAYPRWDEVREKLGSYGLRYQSDHLAYSWLYLHDLQDRVWKEYPETPWGEYAFVLLLRLGMNRSVACADGSDTFRAVIPHGEEFLRQRPESPRRLEVVFTVAQAHETWWSLSQASPKDGYVNAGEYQVGANEARQKAIAYYEQVIELASESDEALYARRRLPRLWLGIDTNQRAFYCIYD